ncbi:MAG: hypothetical protein GX444_04025 [Myxococcales bacterium]|nr:hypothetical protein [Myxococcales bacterium]
MKAHESQVFELYLTRVNRPDKLFPPASETPTPGQRHDETPPAARERASKSAALVPTKPKFSLTEWFCDRALKGFASRVERYPVFISLAALGSGFLVDQMDRHSRLALPPHES